MDTLDAFFAEMTDEQKANVQAVAVDMWEPFTNRVKHHCPQAQIVFDLCDLVKAFGEVIDEARREEVHNTETADDAKVIKGSRYLLLKNRSNLKPKHRIRLRELLSVNERLSAVYQLKDQESLVRHRAHDPPRRQHEPLPRREVRSRSPPLRGAPGPRRQRARTWPPPASPPHHGVASRRRSSARQR